MLSDSEQENRRHDQAPLTQVDCPLPVISILVIAAADRSVHLHYST
jgi:hypothetical protein